MDFATRWQPTTSISLLHLRAHLLTQIRQFFAERQVLEVETPVLAHATVTDKHLHSFQTQYFLDDPKQQQILYLQTSPEYAMKRLLAAGSGPIYQISKAFRNQGESGRYHNPEFTLLEWYRPGFDHHQLMDEVEHLLRIILTCAPAQRFSYAEIFQKYLQIDPHQISLARLKQVADDFKLCIDNSNLSQDDYLNLLMTHIIEPQIATSLVFIYDFPISQAALAKIRPGNPAVAERFEVYMQGLELANGFHELSDATEQRQRFTNDLAERASRSYPQVPIDEYLLTALTHGLPNCAGVALGFDRLLMLKAEAKDIAQVISFPIQRA